MSAIAKRETVENLFRTKLKVLRQFQEFTDLEKSMCETLKPIGGYPPYRVDSRYECSGDNVREKYVDRIIWRYMVKLYTLEKYMLCTEYKKLTDDVENFRTPVFTVENANGWVMGLRSMIYENVRLMCKRVYDKLITDFYYTGGSSSWNSDKKKRNNNGVDNWFIITTYDWNRVFNYWRSTPTITDDLEKVCYILDGKTLPDKTLMECARADKLGELSCPYFTVKFCKNGNTHYKLTDETKERLNRIGPDGNVIGENIRIKILNDN